MYHVSGSWEEVWTALKEVWTALKEVWTAIKCSLLPSAPCCSSQYLRVTGAGSKKKGGSDGAGGGSLLTASHPNLFTYADNSVSGQAVTVPPSYIALGRACVAEDPLQRPTFDEILSALTVVRRDSERMKEEAEMATPAALVMSELEPDPESLSMNTL